ncbi:MAG: hypothetical protein MK105_04985 [Crocinitomicaceae bacterium]|nr:hypothetical protein [Crocinitomicaceae bacterium]
MKRLIIVLLMLVPFVSDAQRKISYAKGTVFGYWGYNRSAYTKSNMRFVGPGYDFTMKGAVAHDNPEKFDAAVYFNPSKLTIPQFNARIGYYFKDNWSISFGYDHMKYIFADQNQVSLSGEIDPGVDTLWSGLYSGEPITTDRNHFHYENSDGLNYLRFELTRTDQWWKTGKKDWFALSTNVGLSAGGILSFNDFRMGYAASDITRRTISLSGYGLSGHLGLRLEFFRHLFLQPNLGAGFHHQVKVKNRPNDASSYTRQAYGYVEANVVIGFLLYIRTKNGCDSCPVW